MNSPSNGCSPNEKAKQNLDWLCFHLRGFSSVRVDDYGNFFCYYSCLLHFFRDYHFAISCWKVSLKIKIRHRTMWSEEKITTMLERVERRTWTSNGILRASLRNTLDWTFDSYTALNKLNCVLFCVVSMPIAQYATRARSYRQNWRLKNGNAKTNHRVFIYSALGSFVSLFDCVSFVCCSNATHKLSTKSAEKSDAASNNDDDDDNDDEQVRKYFAK